MAYSRYASSGKGLADSGSRAHADTLAGDVEYRILEFAARTSSSQHQSQDLLTKPHESGNNAVSGFTSRDP